MLDLTLLSKQTSHPLLLRKIQFKESVNHAAAALIGTTSETASKAKTLKLTASLAGFHPPQVILFDKSKLSEKWSFVKAIGPGLMNLGNTCFLNSVLQCLTYTPSLANYLVSGNHSASCRIQSRCMLCIFQKHVAQCFGNNSKKPISPDPIVSRLRGIAKHFRSGRQEDAHEFARYFIDALVKPLLFGLENIDPSSKETTLLHQIFGGYLCSQVHCLNCDAKSNTYDLLLDISLEIRNCNTLEKAFAHFTKSEALTKNNRYKCESCKKLSNAKKQITIAIPPPVLTIQLKRFDFTQSNRGDKITKAVAYGETIDISPYVMKSDKNSYLYSLYAVLVHSGHSCHSGHYYSFVKNSNGMWFRMDDESVSQASISQVLNQQKGAYMLFYNQHKQHTTVPIMIKDIKAKNVETAKLKKPIILAKHVPEIPSKPKIAQDPVRNLPKIIPEPPILANKKTYNLASLSLISEMESLRPSLTMTPDHEAHRNPAPATSKSNSTKKQEPSPPPEGQRQQQQQPLTGALNATKPTSSIVKGWTISSKASCAAFQNRYPAHHNKWDENAIYGGAVSQWDDVDSKTMDERQKILAAATAAASSKRKRPDSYDKEYDVGKIKKVRKKTPWFVGSLA